MKRWLGIALTLWITLVLFSFVWNIIYSVSESRNSSKETLKAIHKFVLPAIEWNAIHKGVFVMHSSEGSRYNGTLLRRVPPPEMLKEISSLSKKSSQVVVHMFGRENTNGSEPYKPSTIEKLALHAFIAQREPEFFHIQDGKAFYATPLKMEKHCLSCHNNGRFKIGDISGGLGITIPHKWKIPLLSLIVGHLLMGIVGAIFIYMAIFKLDKAYKTIEFQADHDPLTLIPNKRSLYKWIESQKENIENLLPLSIIMCDIDFFKSYNDFYGHSAGDECIKTVARTIKSNLRSRDFCARFGGEEFIIILPETTLKDAIKVAERIRISVEKLQIEHIKSPYKIVTVSLGVATTEDKNTPITEIIKKADAALYLAKNNGRNRVEAFGG